MLFRSIAVFASVAACLVSAAPSPTEVDVPTKVEAALAKRTTHVGEGTIFLQEGGTGSCGQTNPDSAVIAAISNFWMDNESPGPFCGRLIQATNIGSDDGVGGAGNTVTVRVEDTCPSCDENHIDFSEGAWNQLTNNAPFGTIKINWHFCNVDGQC